MRSHTTSAGMVFGLRVAALALCALCAACSQADGGDEIVGVDDGISDEDPGVVPQAFPGERGELRTGVLKIAGVSRTATYEILHNQIVVEGDIVVGPADTSLPEEEPVAEDDSEEPPADLADEVEPAAAVAEPGTSSDGLTTSVNAELWKRGVVYYTVSRKLPDRARVWNAMRHWKKHTPLRFIRRTNQPDFVTFAVGRGCSAQVGKVGGRQFIRLAGKTSCPTSVVIHEIGHAAGFEHEHTRVDRDSHIQVFLNNAEPAFRDQFTKKTTNVNLGPYDVRSVMHYSSKSFAKGSQSTMVKRGGGLIPFNSRLSERDIRATRAVYGPP